MKISENAFFSWNDVNGYLFDVAIDPVALKALFQIDCPNT